MPETRIRQRTDITIWAVSAVITLIGAYYACFGQAVLQSGTSLAAPAWLWPTVSLYYVIGGLALYFAKQIRISRIKRLTIGLFGLIPVILGGYFSIYYYSAASSAFFVAATAAVIYALWKEEPEVDPNTQGLIVYLADATLILLGCFSLVFGGTASSAFAGYAVLVPVIVGSFGAWAHFYRTGKALDHLARTAASVVFLFVAAMEGIYHRTVGSLTYSIMAAALIFYPLARQMRLGAPKEEGLTEENVKIARLERLSELTAWSAFIFAAWNVFLLRSPDINRAGMFAAFIVAYLVFSIAYRAIPARLLTSNKFLTTSIVNTALAMTVAHFTGGLASPFVWYFLFMVITGIVLGEPKKFLIPRYALMGGFFLVEGLIVVISHPTGESAILEEGFLKFFVVGIAAIHGFRLAMEHSRTEGELVRANRELKRALDDEAMTKQLISRRAKEIEESRMRYRAIMSSLADCVVAVDEDGRINLLNPAAEGLLGVREEEAEGRPVDGFMGLARGGDMGSELGSYLEPVFKGNAVTVLEDSYLIRKDGRKVPVDGAIVPISETGGRIIGAVLTMRDATYYREIDKLKNDFISLAAHQLRTPLSTIRWNLELLNDPSEGALKKNQKMFAENAYHSLRRMLALINGLLSVTRVEAGRVPVKPAMIDLAEMTRNILADLEPRIKEKRLSVHVRAESPLQAIPLDPQFSREVFSNLIDNAIRYTPESGTIMIEIYPDATELTWQIRDDGIGIPENQKDHIFEKFFRASNASSAVPEGVGLGLYLVKFIVEHWGGRIWFESKEGAGTTFYVTVPLQGMKPKAGEVSLHA